MGHSLPPLETVCGSVSTRPPVLCCTLLWILLAAAESWNVVRHEHSNLFCFACSGSVRACTYTPINLSTYSAYSNSLSLSLSLSLLFLFSTRAEAMYLNGNRITGTVPEEYCMNRPPPGPFNVIVASCNGTGTIHPNCSCCTRVVQCFEDIPVSLQTQILGAPRNESSGD